MMGYVERIDTGALATVEQPGSLEKPSTVHAFVFGTNGIGLRLTDGILWVTQIAGGARRNYCADPVTARPRAALPFRTCSTLLAADQKFIYYVPDTSNPSSEQIDRAPIDPQCR